MITPQHKVAASVPNLFIVGSMKCGTTILYDFLCSHSEISGSDVKEVHYFTLYEEKGLDWYLDRFDFNRKTRYQLEASPTYFDMEYETDAAKKIKTLSPQAKIIILFRDPLERAVSHFNHLKKVNKIDALSSMGFDEFYNKKWLGAAASDELARLRAYVLDFSKYSEKIKRYISVFGRESVFVIHNNDLRRHGKQVMSSLFNFINLDYQENIDFTLEKYLGGTTNSDVDINIQIDFSKLYGEDYYESCVVIDALRPTPPAGVRFNEPIGATVSEVTYGKDGWLFLTGGANNPARMLTGSSIPAAGWTSLLCARHERLKSRDTAYYHCIIPEKLTVLGNDYLNWNFEPADSAGFRFAQETGGNIKEILIDLFYFFTRYPGKESLYLKTDSHWSGVGAFAAYQMICAKLGIKFRADLLTRPYTVGTLGLDLGTKLPDQPQETVKFYAFRQEAEIVQENELVRLKRATNRENDAGLHVGSMIRFVNQHAPERRSAILFGDSFSEYRDHLLTGLLAETFSELTFVWSINLDYKLIDKLDPDVVISAQTERFMMRVPEDTFDVEEFEAERLRKLDEDAVNGSIASKN